jgi:antagonist of KipI
MLSTIQDMGRRLYLSQAVPLSGPIDTLSARIVNKALYNEDHAAVIEFTYANAAFEAETDILIAYAGDGAVLKGNDKELPAERPVFIPCGTMIRLINNNSGSRTYLSVAGGWDVHEILGSRSTYLTAALGGLQGRALQPGDILNSIEGINPVTQRILNSLNGDKISYPEWGLARQRLLPVDRKTIRVIPGREYNWFESKSIQDFLSTPYTLSLRSNRMGYHLEGATIERTIKDELLSTAVTPGTIQVTGNGSMVILMADCQTTGGYPRIAQVAAVDLPLCGQLKPGDAVYFKEISHREAEMLYIEREKQLQRLGNAVKNRFL